MRFSFTLGVSSLWILFNITLHSVALVILHGVSGSASSYFCLSPRWARFRFSTPGKTQRLGFLGQGTKSQSAQRWGILCVFFTLNLLASIFFLMLCMQTLSWSTGDKIFYGRTSAPWAAWSVYWLFPRQSFVSHGNAWWSIASNIL